MYDAVIIGSGPNGLAAAIRLAQSGLKVQVLEGHHEIGGGTRTSELTIPGFHHDVCSSVHPMGCTSPFLSSLPLGAHGLEWIFPAASVAHPLDNAPAILLEQSVEATASQLGIDQKRYKSLLQPFVERAHEIVSDSLNPLSFPKHPFSMARFGLKGLQSAVALARNFQTDGTRALIAGCAAHSILPLDKTLTAAVALIFMLTGHIANWPVAKGGSMAITNAMASYLRSLGADVVTSYVVKTPADLPPAKVYLFDTSPNLLVDGFTDVLPAGYIKRLSKFRYGPGVFKIDYALSGSIPWKDPRCLKASTVHLGGTLPEIAAAESEVWEGKHPEKPFILLTQQSEFDNSRAPAHKHTLWAYCHVPHGSTQDMSGAIEKQIERFAPGFRDLIIARHTMNTKAFESYNPNYLGGAITGGVTDLCQFVARPVARWNPYATPNSRIFLCSASTPPGGGVHGMCGFHAAEKVIKRIDGLKFGPLS
jgi:phytoene dehydrogenase-like protein